VVDRIKFDGGLPKRHLEALAALKPGSLDRIALELPGNPLRLQSDERVVEKSTGARTGSLLANAGGRPLCYVEVGGPFGRELMVRGHAAAVEFAVEWLARLFGNGFKPALKRTQSTRWEDEPWIRGAFSVAVPGGQWARAALREPVRDRIYFGGEATHDTLWGTVNGAWESGDRAANAVLRRLGPLPGQSKPKPEQRAPRRQSETR
jgi:Flavin containing amine oxidoreductase